MRLTAAEINATHIDQRITFSWHFPSGVDAEVCGDLRQIDHDAHQTVLNLTSSHESNGRLDEFVLTHDTTVVLL